MVMHADIELREAVLEIKKAAMRLGNALRAQREARSASKSKISRDIDISIPTLVRIERGHILDGKVMDRLTAWSRKRVAGVQR